MVARLSAALCFVALAAMPVAAQVADDKDPNVIIYLGHSPAMRAAIDKARDTFPEALEAAFQGGARLSDGFSVKVAIPAGDQTENIWVDSVSQTGDGFVGRFANEPRHLAGKSLGSAVAFDASTVIDWALPTASGKFWGHYTTRVILQNMAPEKARRVRQHLSLRPAPRNW
jgi:uncharacterized protein YegJ (DUF2314 family)